MEALIIFLVLFGSVYLIIKGVKIQRLKKNEPEQWAAMVADLKQKKEELSDPHEPVRYESIDEWESDQSVLWRGKQRTIEFTYEPYGRKKERRIIDLMEVSKNPDGRVYFKGYCHLRKAERTFNIDNITTMIKERSKRYDVYDFINDELGVEFA